MNAQDEEFERSRQYWEAIAFSKRLPLGVPEPRYHAPSCELFKIGLDHVPACDCGLDEGK